MKAMVLLIAGLIAGVGGVWGQKKDPTLVVSAAKSAPIAIVALSVDTMIIVPAVQFPPVLEISELSFVGTENEGFMSAEEKGFLRFKIQNTGESSAYNLRLFATETNGLNGLKFNSHKFITKQFVPGETRLDSIYVEGNNKLRNGKANFQLMLSEANGYKSSTAAITVFTRQAQKPAIDITNYEIFEIDDREMRCQMDIQNIGSSNIKGAKISVSYPNTVYLKGDGIKELPLLKPDESVEIEFTFVKSKSFDKVSNNDFKVNIADATGQLLAMTKVMPPTTIATTEPLPLIKSDVDCVIPPSPNASGQKNEHIYVLIIGNEQYMANQNVPYAINDANTFRQYCLRTFNIPKSNIDMLHNATGNQMRYAFRTLANKALYDPTGEAELIIYYSGHGIIAKDKYDDTNSGYDDQYLIPADVIGADASLSISRQEIYRFLNEAPFKRASIFLDACNIPGDRGIIKEAKYEWKGKVFVFASSLPQQTSGAYKEKNHGLFTYFLLKSIQAKKGKISYDELTQTVIKDVSSQSRTMVGKEQNPDPKFSPQAADEWKKWKMPE